MANLTQAVNRKRSTSFILEARNVSDTLVYYCVTSKVGRSWNCHLERKLDPEFSICSEFLAGKYSVDDMSVSLDLVFLFPLDFHWIEDQIQAPLYLCEACCWDWEMAPLVWVFHSDKVTKWLRTSSSQNSLLLKNLAVPPTGKCRETRCLSGELRTNCPLPPLQEKTWLSVWGSADELVSHRHQREICICR